MPTGQTGMMIDGWGVAVDRVISDFVNGTCEWLLEQAEARGDWIIVEGQGSLDHPAYSAVTLGLIHGTTPQAMVMVHKPGLPEHDWDHVPDRTFPLQPLNDFIRLHEQVAGVVAPSKVVAVALNTSLYADEADARRVIAETAAETGLPDRRSGPLRPRAPVGRDPGRGRGPRPDDCPAMSLELTSEVIRLPYREPFRIARSHGGDGMSSVIVELRNPAWPGLVGYGEGYPDAYYGETLETIGVVLPLLLGRDLARLASRLAPTDGAPASRRSARRSTRRSPTTAPPSARSTRRSTISSASASACRSTRSSACRRRSAQPTSRSGSTSPRSSPPEPHGRPGSRPSRSRSAARPTSRRSRPSGASTRARSGSTRTRPGRPSRAPG